MEIHPVDIIIALINIIVLFMLLRAILWKPVTRYLDERAARVQSELDNAAALKQDAESLRSKYDEKIEDLEERSREIIQESRLRASEEAEQIICDARIAANKLISDAEFNIELSRNQAVKEAHADIAQLAMSMATRILEREVSEADNEKIVNSFFRDL